MTLQSINPATEDIIKTYEEHSDQFVQDAIERSVRAFTHQKHLSFEERGTKLQKMSDLLEKDKDAIATLMTSEMGKTHKSAVAEVEKCAWVCRHYAENGADYLKDEHIKTDKSASYIAYLPLGPILAVMPWNFPLWQVIRFAAPALMAGNTCLLKHASNVAGCAVLIEDYFRRAGFDAHEFQTLLIGSKKVAQIIEDERVRGVTLTGSEGAGKAVAKQAAYNLKPTVLELGGSDPFIVMPSADMNNALDMAVTGRIQNNGQSCIAAKRFIIHTDVYDEFREKMAARFEKLKVGDPMDADTDVGPLAMAQILDELEEQVEETLKKGAKRVTGAKRLDRKGYFMSPGILENIPEDAPAYTEELFGPVACFYRVASLEEAVTLGNITRFGLGSAIMTEDDTDKAYAIKHLDAGGTFINTITASDPRLPFGGIKASGYGRELSRDGIREFVNIKTVVEK